MSVRPILEAYADELEVEHEGISNEQLKLNIKREVEVRLSARGIRKGAVIKFDPNANTKHAGKELEVFGEQVTWRKNSMQIEMTAARHSYDPLLILQYATVVG